MALKDNLNNTMMDSSVGIVLENHNPGEATFVSRVLHTVDPNVSSGSHWGEDIAVGDGVIVVGAPFDSFGGDTTAGGLTILDLDGNFIRHISPDVDGGVLGTSRTTRYMGRSVAVGDGRIVAGMFSNSLPNTPGGLYILDMQGQFINYAVHPSAGSSNDYKYVGYASCAVGGGVIAADSGNYLASIGKINFWDLNGNFLSSYAGANGGVNDQLGTNISYGDGKFGSGAPLLNSEQGAAFVFPIAREADGILSDQMNYGTMLSGISGTLQRHGHAVNIASGSYVAAAPRYNTYQGKIVFYTVRNNHVFNNSWETQRYGDTGLDRFGTSLATGSNRIAVGAPQDTTGPGYVRIFSEPPTASTIATLYPSDGSNSTTTGMKFGAKVAIGCGRIVVAAPGWNSNSGLIHIYKLRSSLIDDFEAWRNKT